ncbi:hypothetical protein [Streptomyces olivoreticuli]|uniref:hypothetical protein n=1 Tax=Streptomyces olivoreticuli TaxID=68246 RepID=UPI0013C33D7A|nr:hypothetical protein [Streptomyces olivoreticuli]
MKKLLEGIGVILLMGGISTVVHEFTGFFRLWAPCATSDSSDSSRGLHLLVLEVG